MMRRMRAGALRQDLQDRVRVLLEPVERVVDELLGYVGVPEIAERVDKHHLGIEEPVSSPRAGLNFRRSRSRSGKSWSVSKSRLPCSPRPTCLRAWQLSQAADKESHPTVRLRVPMVQEIFECSAVMPPTYELASFMITVGKSRTSAARRTRPAHCRVDRRRGHRRYESQTG